MVELQLEKISPLPVAQIVWSFETLAQAGGDMQTVIVTIAARAQVESFLGQLEGQGYLVDRLELPVLDQLRVTPVEGDGVWIYPDLGADGHSCLLAWWYGNVLCDLGLIRLPTGEQRFAVLQEHLTQTAWAGEIEGWLTSEPRYHLVASPETAALWQHALAQEVPCEVLPPEAPARLAARTAQRAVAGESRPNLLPAEFVSRYKQRWIDRLWMRALGAVVALYIAGVALYLGWTQMVRWQCDHLNEQIAALTPEYDTTTRLKAQVQVLRDQVSLQFASLDCYKAIADALPTELTLKSLGFDGVKGLSLSGTATADSVPQVYGFIEKLRHAEAAGQRIFRDISSPTIGTSPGQNQRGWTLHGALTRSEDL